VTFVFTAALAIALLVIAPFAAHLLRVRRAKEQPFPPAHLVPALTSSARQRKKLEDRALFSIRLLAILALAVLGATPLLTCSKLSISRDGGASLAVAIVLDDSMSMRARDDGTTTRFALAKQQALDLFASARQGDAIAIVLAGAPARVVLAPTMDLSLAEHTLQRLEPSDRATDLEGAMALGASLLSELPQPQHRMVVLTDRCDGMPDAPPLGEGLSVPTWIVSRQLSENANDCAVLYAEQRSGRVYARVACTGNQRDPHRNLVVREAGQTIAREPIFPHLPQDTGTAELDVPIASSAFPDEVALEGSSDFIAENDVAPVARRSTSFTVGVVSDRSLSNVETGGPPPVEQALVALHTGATIHPMTVMPDTVEELSKLTILVIDDPAGFTPETRESLHGWVERGGVALVGLGPRSARAPLGATLEPLVSGIPHWAEDAPDSVNERDCLHFGPSGPSLLRLEAKGRAHFPFDGPTEPTAILRWSDNLPLIVERTLGRGTITVVGLPFSPQWSDLPFRPAFLALLKQLVDDVGLRAGSKRIDVGQSWVIDSESVEVRTKSGPYPVAHSQGKTRITPHEAGRYDLRIAQEVDSRIASIPAHEVDLRPRRITETNQENRLGTTSGTIDISRWIALFLLFLLAVELGLRARNARLLARDSAR
jgi:Mg-chelatase subunit ChlD